MVDKWQGARENSGTLPRSIYALSSIWQEHCRIVAFSRSFIIKSRIATFKIISVDITSNRRSGFLDIVILCQICFFILEAAEPTLYHDVISPTAFTIHALSDSILFYKVNVLLNCELAALIRVENLWLCHFESLLRALITILVSSVSSTSQPTIQRRGSRSQQSDTEIRVWLEYM